MRAKKFLVITSIANDRNKALKAYAKSLPKDFGFVVVGDKKSPKAFQLKNCLFLSAERQKRLGLETAKKLPWHTYARKNIGYLTAMQGQCEEIYETDDDNFPYETFFRGRKFQQEKNILANAHLVNVYPFFTTEDIWPRGFPIEHLRDKKSTPFARLKKKKLFTPILQGLADENPDVDALYRIIKKLPVSFHKNKSLSLANTYSPFNSQNTIWHKKAFPLLYIPSYCSFRMCDIWRSFIALRICFEYGWGINFFSPTVYQERNPHDLLKDFIDEIEGYKHNAAIIAGLRKLKLHKQQEKIYDNLMLCHQFMVKEKHIQKEELPLLRLWIKDCKKLLSH